MDASSCVVFVIDDEPADRARAAALVSSMGWECRTFTSAEQFLDHVSPSRGGCAIVALRLPGMDGMALQRHLIRLGSTMPVILVGGEIDVATAVRAMQNGAVTVLEKPCQTDQLADAIRTALKLSRTRQRTLQRRTALLACFENLDRRERGVMKMIVHGLPNKTIARKVGVCQRTAAQIRAEVCRKMGVGSAVELALLAGELWRHDCGGLLTYDNSEHEFRRPGNDGSARSKGAPDLASHNRPL